MKNLLLIVVFLYSFISANAQNEQISIQSISDKEFSVNSINGIPFTVVIEESNNDGQFHLPSGGSVTFRLYDMIENRSTLRIIFEEEMYHSLEDKLINQYTTELEWIGSTLNIKDNDLKMFPTRPVFTDAALEKLKSKVFDYVDTDEKEDYFNQWIEKINYSVGAVQYFSDMYAASNGENNSQRRDFLPINISEALQKNR
ncbi:hypothetical protein [Aquimarina algicola]|uniref:DUF4369 domain-containing protein n=1 Tax=Aquimarina algicola TaxID=2589995 RepID=A0A504J5C6_9FLAO|nr:hypothetical protein [Aquimarina algicola]TPN82279.1 hypothetical protein FHK87_22915 [Aquimarina algicola]